MARRKRGGAPAISLFPFLSILACVIGTLTLMITALALGQMDDPTVEIAENYVRVTKKHAADLAAVEQLKTQLADAQATAGSQHQALAAARDEIERLHQEIEQLAKQPPPSETPKGDDQVQQRIAELENEIRALTERVKQLLEQIENRSVPQEAVVRIQPGGSGVNLKPTFVECAAGRIVIYAGDQPHPVRRADMAKDAAFQQLLKRIADTENETVIFLVRDDAIGTYFTARNLAREKYARNGKLPVIGHGKIDLSLFKKKVNES
jgi:prefoldin subunit 5